MSIEDNLGHLDIMGEMYSEFLKYALGDGKEIGIVINSPYVTKMMAEILGVNQHSRDGFSYMVRRFPYLGDGIDGTRCRKNYEETTEAKNKIVKKQSQLLGVELNAEMFILAATNMILRGDGSSNIQKRQLL